MRCMILPLMLLVAAACQPATMELTDAEKAAIEDEISALENDLTASVVGWDLDTFLSFFSDDLSWALFGSVYHSRSSWVDHVTPSFTEAASLETCDINDLRYQVLTADVVISTCVVKCFGPATAGSPVVIDHTWTTVWAKRDGLWKIENLSETFRTAETPPEDT